MRHDSAMARLVSSSDQVADHGVDVAEQLDTERRIQTAIDRVRALPQADQVVREHEPGSYARQLGLPNLK